MFVRYHRGLRSLQQITQTLNRNWVTDVQVFWGSTGLGKTRRVWDEVTALDKQLWVHAGDRWFDGYDRHEYVLFDDFEGIQSGITYRKFLQLLDRYAMQVPTKGGFVSWAPKRIYITSNVPYNMWYPGNDPAPIRRRLSNIVHFDSLE